MAGKVLKADTSAADAYATIALAPGAASFWLQFGFAVPQATLDAIVAAGSPDYFTADLWGQADGLFGTSTDGSAWKYWTDFSPDPAAGTLTADAWHTLVVHVDHLGTDSWHLTWKVDGATVQSYDSSASDGFFDGDFKFGGIGAQHVAGELYYIDSILVGTTEGGSDLFSADFEDGTTDAFDGTTGSVSVIDDPGFDELITDGRVGIAFDAGPLDADPVFTFIDQLYENLVSGVDIETGKQTELDRTDTGTMTVYLNDTAGLFDPLNTLSPYFGKLDGKPLLVQLYNPVTATWEKQARGTINDYTFDVNPATNPDGSLVVATIQIECVDVFDYLGGYQLRLGSDGDTPPAGAEGTIFYEDTEGTVDDRIIQALTDASIDATRWVVFSGNVKVMETKYDPGDAILNVLRDAADAEFPGIANIYVDRFGRFVFHGRYARFDPEGVIAAGPVSTDTWDFHRWKVGDGLAIVGDSDYAQMRVLAYTHGRTDIVNYAISWPRGIAETDMPGQSFEDATSQDDFGMHALPPMGDLIISEGTTTGNNGNQECAKFAEFFVHYLKDPQTRITELMVKAIGPTDPRAASTWDVLCRADISDIMRTTVGYPGGVGLDMDNYIEGYTKRIRPLNPGYDYVEAEYRLTPTAWAMDPDGILAASS